MTRSPKVTPKRYKDKSKKIKGIPKLRTDTPNRGIAIKTAGIKPVSYTHLTLPTKA